jgi:death-on-curing protein
VDEVVEAHQLTLRRHGGAAGIRDVALLDSAVHAPQATFGGELLLPGVFDIAAGYLLYLCMNHPFVDGNKRAAWLATRLFLRLNGFALRPRRREAVSFVLRVAAGEIREWPEISRWLARHAQPR